MKRESSSAVAVVAMNMVVISLLVINKAYKAHLDKLAKQYSKYNKVNHSNFAKNSKIGKEEKIKVLKQVVAELPPAENILKDGLLHYPLTEISKYQLFSQSVEEMFYEKVKRLQKMEIVPYQIPHYMLVGAGLSECAISKNYTVSLENTNLLNRLLPTLCVALSVAISLQIVELGTDVKREILDSAILEEIETVFEYPEYFFPMENYALSSTNPHVVNIEREITYQDQFGAILAKNLPMKAKIEEILQSGFTDYTNTFSYILGIENLSIEDKVHFILQSNLTSYQNIFHFLLWDSGLMQFESMEYIVNSNIATYEEKFQFIAREERFTTEQKVWYALMIPNDSFERVFQDLLTMDGVSTDQIINTIIEADMVPFETLFNTILKSDVLPKEQFVMLLVSYHNNYNSATVEEKIHYMMQITSFSDSFKADAYLAILSSCYSLEESVDFILNDYGITYLDYLNYYTIASENLTSEQRMVLSLFERINIEKEKYILEHYAFESKEQLYAVIGGVAAESTNSYYDMYWVSNVFFNRITDCNYAKKGENPYLQFIAPKQFAVYASRAYKLYLTPSNQTRQAKFCIAKQAFYDMFYAGYDGIRHDYLEFRESSSTLYTHYVVKSGNRYGVLMDTSKRIIYENLVEEELSLEEQDALVLQLITERVE